MQIMFFKTNESINMNFTYLAKLLGPKLEFNPQIILFLRFSHLHNKKTA